MFASILFDVAGPGVLIFAALFSFGALTILTIVITVLEAVVMVILKWDKFGRALLASFLMNLTSTIVGSLIILVGIIYFSYMAVIIAFILSVLIEGGVLMLMKRGSARQNWIVSVSANLVSYLLIILPFLWFRLR